MVVGTPCVAKDLPNASNADRHYADARKLRARARRYRRLADLLCDEKIIAIVLACASEFDEHADALISKQNASALPIDCVKSA